MIYQPNQGFFANGVPRNLEVILVRASFEPDFREDLVKNREKAALLVDFPFTPEERPLLRGIPEQQLRALISAIRIPPEKAGEVQNLLQQRKGQGWIEYFLILALIGVFMTAALTSSGGHIPSIFNQENSLAAFRAITVKNEHCGTPFIDAIKALELECKVKISVKAPPELNLKESVKRSTQNINLEAVLRQMTIDVASPTFQANCAFFSTNLVDLQFLSLKQEK